jgi:hypothetical protein
MDLPLEDSLRTFVVKYGYKTVFEKLQGLREEFRQFYEEQIVFLAGVDVSIQVPQQTAPTPPPTPNFQPDVPLLNEFIETKTIAISESAVFSGKGKDVELEECAAPVAKKRIMKVIRKDGRSFKVPQKELELEPVLVAEAPAVAVAAPVTDEYPVITAVKEVKRTPAEMKRWQREREAARRAFMKANKISRASLMTADNVRRWIEVEGNTYAWVARDKLGCKEEEVSKFAKEHGIVRKRDA